LRRSIARGAEEFLGHLLEVNSARVQSDVSERVRESRVKFESEVLTFLRRATTVAANALDQARIARAAGAGAVEAALARLGAFEVEIRNLISSEE
jgi:hypothetical protein